jgi:predicted  nucleic acid-binding Zn-ribbon protein
MQQPTATANSTISAAEVGRRLANGEQGQELAKELGISEATFSRANASYLKAYISQLKTEAEQAKAETVKAKQTASQLQGTKEGLQKSCERLHVELNQLQQSATNLQAKGEQLQVTETNLQSMASRLQQSETKLQTVTSQLQAKASQLQAMETERNQIATELQAAETERNQIATELQAVTVERDGLATELQAGRKSITEQQVLTHPRFLLWAIIGFEGYNAWQLFSNMQLQMFPFLMAMVFALFFGLASVTALAANHRWGVWVCVASAFVSNAIHANLFVAPSLAGGFYTLLPCVLVYLFADMYKNKIVFNN